METKLLVLSIEAAAGVLGTTKQTVYTIHSTDPTFPRIFKVGKRKSGLLLSELEEWLKDRRENYQIESRPGRPRKMDGAV